MIIAQASIKLIFINNEKEERKGTGFYLLVKGNIITPALPPIGAENRGYHVSGYNWNCKKGRWSVKAVFEDSEVRPGEWEIHYGNLQEFFAEGYTFQWGTPEERHPKPTRPSKILPEPIRYFG